MNFFTTDEVSQINEFIDNTVKNGCPLLTKSLSYIFKNYKKIEGLTPTARDCKIIKSTEKSIEIKDQSKPQFTFIVNKAELYFEVLIEAKSKERLSLLTLSNKEKPEGDDPNGLFNFMAEFNERRVFRLNRDESPLMLLSLFSCVVDAIEEDLIDGEYV